MWALKGLFKSVTKRDPPGTESDDSPSGMENETEESNNKTARVFIKNQEELFERKQGNNIKVMEPCPVLAMKSLVSTAFYFPHFFICRSVEYGDKLGIFTTIYPSFPPLSFFT